MSIRTILLASILLALGSFPAHAQELFWTSHVDSSIHRMKLDGSGETSIPNTPVAGRTHVVISRGKAYWVSDVDFSIHRANLDGTGSISLGTTATHPYRTVLSIDPGAGKLYWSGSNSTIHRVNIDGTEEENLGTSPISLTHIALDTQNGKMYWCSDFDHQIHRANLDGTGETSLGSSYVRTTTTLTLDVDGGKMYWASPDTNTIHRANLDGSSEEDLMIGNVVGQRHIISDAEQIVLDGNGKLYWPDNWTKSIHRANLDGTGEEVLNTSHVSVGEHIVIAGNKMYWPSGHGQIHSANLDGSAETSLGNSEIHCTTPLVLSCEVPAGAVPVGGGLNPSSYAVTAPTLGATSTLTVDLAGTTGHNLALVLGYQTSLSLTLGGGQVLLVNVADPNGELLGLSAMGGGTPSWSVPITEDVVLCGFTFSTQAVHIGGVQPFALSNGYDLTVGY